MNAIKFSHNYPKLWNQTQAKLVAVELLDARTLHDDLIEYDTRILSGDDAAEYYELPKTGKLIQLVFIGGKGIPFCTLRRHTDEKYDYYINQIYKVFDVVIT
jgi:hypothetical protein